MRPNEKLASQPFDLKQTYRELDDLPPILYAAKHGIVGFIDSQLSQCTEEEKVSLLGTSNAAGLTALHYACLYGHVETTKALIGHGAPILKASSLQLLPIHLIFNDRNDINSCVALFNLFINPQDWITKTTNANENLAHLAAAKGAIEILKAIKAIAPGLLNAKDNQSLTPLLRAVLNNQLEVTDYLLHHSDAQQKNSKGQNALHIAVLSSSNEMMNMLLPYFDCHATDNENHSALELAKKYGKTNKQEIIEKYIDHNSTGMVCK